MKNSDKILFVVLHNFLKYVLLPNVWSSKAHCENVSTHVDKGKILFQEDFLIDSKTKYIG